jgi:ubiquitin-protein ligase
MPLSLDSVINQFLSNPEYQRHNGSVLFDSNTICNSAMSIQFETTKTTGNIKSCLVTYTSDIGSGIRTITSPNIIRILNALTGKFARMEHNFDFGKPSDTLHYSILKPNAACVTQLLELMSHCNSEGTEIDSGYLAEQISKLYGQEYCPYIFSDSQVTPIISFYKAHSDSLSLLAKLVINSLLAGERANRIYNPRPVYIKTIDNSRINGKVTVQDIAYQIGLLLNYLETDSAKWEDSTSERKLWELGWMAYDMLLCAITNFNQFHLEPIVPPNIQLSGSKKLKIYRVQYNDPDKTAKFDPLMTKTGHTAFHGSNIENWYSIFNNGLYVATGTDVLHGATYGTGIYLSSTAEYSSGYCAKRAHHKKSSSEDSKDDCESFIANATEMCIMGVFTVMDPLEKFKKSGNIHVVNDTSLLCLRYLIVSSDYKFEGLCHWGELDKFFVLGGAAESAQKEKQLKQARGSGRIMKELRDMTQTDTVNNDEIKYEFRYSDDNIMIWEFDLLASNFMDSSKPADSPKQPDLYRDCLAMRVDRIKFEIRLPEDYPFSPPFVRIVSPRFQQMTGYVTYGGSICFELLTKGGWVAAMSVVKVMIAVMINMIEGKARLDRNSPYKEYGYKEAVDAYGRILQAHKHDWGLDKK